MATRPIKPAELNVLHENYLTNKHAILSNELGRPDTEKIWLEKNNFLIEFLKSVIDDTKANGMFVYLAAYGSTHPEGMPPGTDYSNRLTIGLRATTVDGSGRIIDYDRIEPLNHTELLP